MTLYDKIFEKEFSQLNFVRSNKRVDRLNIPCAFDIETTSLYVNDEKRAIMYIWMFGIDTEVYYGRTWEEFSLFIGYLSSRLNLYSDRNMIVYVHNLAFEFQFIKDLFEWEKVFALTKHKPIYARTVSGIEFRCSYLLSGLKLEKVGDNLSKKVKKLVGNLDYELIRHHKTILTEEEMAYCENDILILLEYIREQIAEYRDNINYIPLTNTGRVRNYCRKQTLYKDYTNYHSLIRDLTLSDEEYNQMKRAFQGGFTHASFHYSGKVVDNVTSYDFASSYPYVMVSELYPMSSPILVTDFSKPFTYYLDRFCCVFDAEFKGVQSTKWEHPISESRCYIKEGILTDNGRIVEADRIMTTITEQDFTTITDFYKWESLNVYNLRIMKKGYLPKDFILSILKLYSDKTMLKNVPGKEAEYMRSKNMINSCYGMTVTDIAKDEITFECNNWGVKKADVESAMSRYNKSKRRFLYYPWGVWVTAYARRNLFVGISEFDGDYVYADTDSIKSVNTDRHMDYIKAYNLHVEEKLKFMCKSLGIDYNLCTPKSPDGKTKTLGVWDFDGHYKKFKTMGAKRYMTLDDNDKLSITIAGVNKKLAIPYIQSTKRPFEFFDDGMKIPAEFSGKLTHTYIEGEDEFYLVDYTGKKALVRSISGVHLEKSSYEMSLAQMYIEYLGGLRHEVV